MIHITNKKDCCGCSACVQICPKQCIDMTADNEGFLYPYVDNTICIDCGLCEKVCPIINQNAPRKPLAVYAAKNTNEKIRLKSSSGGIFTLLAEQIISEGGVIFGAKFNENWEVVHDYTETVEGLAPFRGSKYVQSIIGDNFFKAKRFLTEGRKVLFSGTPCQIAGLNKYLRKEYDNLLTVDVICHGVPSPMVWRDYLYYKRAKRAAGKNSVSSSLNELPLITDISFRDKTNGWKKYGFKISYRDNCEITPYNEDLFMKGFLKNLYLRPICYACAARSGKSSSDITIGDFWGIQKHYPEFDDNKGIGLILINSEKGKLAYDIASHYNIETTYEQALSGNPCLECSTVLTDDRQKFWQDFPTNQFQAVHRICKKGTPSLAKRIFKRIINKLK